MTSSSGRLLRWAGATLLAAVIETLAGAVLYHKEEGIAAGVLHWVQMALLLASLVLLIAAGISHLKSRITNAAT